MEGRSFWIKKSLEDVSAPVMRGQTDDYGFSSLTNYLKNHSNEVFFKQLKI